MHATWLVYHVCHLRLHHIGHPAVEQAQMILNMNDILPAWHNTRLVYSLLLLYSSYFARGSLISQLGAYYIPFLALEMASQASEAQRAMNVSHSPLVQGVTRSTVHQEDPSLERELLSCRCIIIGPFFNNSSCTSSMPASSGCTSLSQAPFFLKAGEQCAGLPALQPTSTGGLRENHAHTLQQHTGAPR